MLGHPTRPAALKPLLFEIAVQPAAQGSRAALAGITRQLRDAIRDGRLPRGARLPATRDAQAQFGVSRNTLAEVYERLLHEGFVVARHGVGTFVADVLPGASAPRRTTPPAAVTLNPFWLRPDVSAAMGFWREAAAAPSDTPRAASTAEPIELRPALVDARLFPFDVLRRLMVRELRALERKPARFRSPQGNQGNFALRDAIRRHIALTRAVVCAADDVLVTSGAQQAFDLLARVLVTPGKTVVAVEDPGYPPLRVAFAAAGAKLVPVGVDADGLLVDRLPRDAGIVCLCPSHQFPLGVTMSPQRRQQLIAFARRVGAVIVEDDYDGEFRHDGTPIAALRSAEADDVVFYVGTFSKCMLPSLRLGFLVAPAWSLPTLVAAKNALDWHCSIPLQLAVAAFVADGHLTHHVRKMRQVYRQRREQLLRALAQQCGEWLTPIPAPYGMHVGADLRAGLDSEAISAQLAARGVRVHDFTRYWLGAPTRHGLLFGVGAVEPAPLRTALRHLHEVLKS